MKKRNCRMTPKEREQHERATKIRKMTDQQLFKYIDGLCSPQQVIGDFLYDVENRCKGIGQITIAKLRNFARGDGFIS